jgi:hypothetical protein
MQETTHRFQLKIYLVTVLCSFQKVFCQYLKIKVPITDGSRWTFRV